MKKWMCFLLVAMAVFLHGCGQANSEKRQVREQLVGQWVKVSDCIDGTFARTLLFSADGTVTDESGERGAWTSEGWVVQLPGGERKLLHSAHGLWTLGMGPGGYMRPEDVQEALIWVELSDDNLGQYVELVDMPYRRRDGKAQGSALWLGSKALDRGLCYVGSTGLSIEIQTPNGILENRLSPFGAAGDAIDEASDLRAADCALVHGSGTLLFVREDLSGWEITEDQRMVHILGEDRLQPWPYGAYELEELPRY